VYIYNKIVLGVAVTKDQFFVKSGRKLQCGHLVVLPIKKFCAECGKSAKLKETFVPTENFADWCRKSGISLSKAWLPDETIPGQLAAFQVNPIYDIECKGEGQIAFGFCMYFCTGSDEGCRVNFDLLGAIHEYKVKLFLALTELGLSGEPVLYPTVMASY